MHVHMTKGKHPSCFNCRQDGSELHAEGQSDMVLHPHHMAHNLQREQRKQSVSASSIFVIIHATHVHEASQKVKATAPKVGAKKSGEGIALRLLTPDSVA